ALDPGRPEPGDVPVDVGALRLGEERPGDVDLHRPSVASSEQKFSAVASATGRSSARSSCPVARAPRDGIGLRKQRLRYVAVAARRARLWVGLRRVLL